MYLHQGFSLVEVLWSLILVATIAFGLLQQQNQAQLILNQLLLRSQASYFLDEINEKLLLKTKTLPKVPEAYRLTISRNKHSQIINLSWYNDSQSIQRITQY